MSLLPSDSIKHVKQAGVKLAEARDKLKDALDHLRGRQPEAAAKITDLIDALVKKHVEIVDIVRLLESDKAL
jgi:hypothetical protein